MLNKEVKKKLDAVLEKIKPGIKTLEHAEFFSCAQQMTVFSGYAEVCNEFAVDHGELNYNTDANLERLVKSRIMSALCYMQDVIAQDIKTLEKSMECENAQT